MKITGEYVSKGKLFTEMENMKDANVNGERYMRSKDVKKMAQEVTSSVVAEVVTDYLYEENEGIKRSWYCNSHCFLFFITNRLLKYRRKSQKQRNSQWAVYFKEHKKLHKFELLSKIISKSTYEIQWE